LLDSVPCGYINALIVGQGNRFVGLGESGAGESNSLESRWNGMNMERGLYFSLWISTIAAFKCFSSDGAGARGVFRAICMTIRPRRIDLGE